MKDIKAILFFITLLMPFSMAFVSAAEKDTIYVIVNQKLQITELDKKQVMSLFLGRARNFPNGDVAKPFDQKIGSSVRESFFKSLTGKEISDIDAYWARLSYSGRAFPPKSFENVNDIVEEVSRNKNAISYVKGKSAEELLQKGINIVYSIKAQ